MTSTYALALLPHEDTEYSRQTILAKLTELGLDAALPQPCIPLIDKIPGVLSQAKLCACIESAVKHWRQLELARRTRPSPPLTSVMAMQEGVKVVLKEGGTQSGGGARTCAGSESTTGGSGTGTGTGSAPVVERVELPHKKEFDVVACGVTGEGVVFVDLEDDASVNSLWECLRKAVTEEIVHRGQDASVKDAETRHAWVGKHDEGFEVPGELPRFELGVVANANTANNVLRELETFRKEEGAERVIVDSVGLIKCVDGEVQLLCKVTLGGA